MSQTSARYQRSTGGLLGAMLVLVVVVVGWVGVRAVSFDHPDSAMRTVDYAEEVPAARRAADFDLVAPPRLPRGWRATTVRFSPPPQAHWHLGVLTDEDRYVGLEQGTRPARAMLEEYVDPSPRRARPAQVGGLRWSTYTDADGDLALVRRADRTTTLVVGHEVPRSTLVAYAASLR